MAGWVLERTGDSPWVAAWVPAGCRYHLKSRSACLPPGSPGEKSQASPVSLIAAPMGAPGVVSRTCWTAARLWSWALVRCCCWSAAVCSIRCCCCAAYICCRYCAAVLGCRCSACWITFLWGANTSPGCTATPKRHPPTSSPPPRAKISYLDGLAVGDAAVDRDLGSGRAGGAGAAGCRGGAAGTAGGRRCRELLVLHGGLPGSCEVAGVRLELGRGVGEKE